MICRLATLSSLERPSLELVGRTGRQDVWMRSGVVLPSEVCSRSVWLTRSNRISAEEHLRVKLSTGSHRFTGDSSQCCDCCVLYVYSGQEQRDINIRSCQLFANFPTAKWTQLLFPEGPSTKGSQVQITRISQA